MSQKIISFKQNKRNYNNSLSENLETELKRLSKGAKVENDRKLLELARRLASNQDNIYDLKLEDVKDLKDLKNKIDQKAKQLVDDLETKCTDEIELETFQEHRKKLESKFFFFPLCVEIVKLTKVLDSVSEVLGFLDPIQFPDTVLRLCDSSIDPNDQLWSDIRTRWITQKYQDFISVADSLGNLLWSRSLYVAFFNKFSFDDNIKEVLTVLTEFKLSDVEIMNLIIDSNNLIDFKDGVGKMRLFVSFKALLQVFGCPTEDYDSYSSILKGSFNSFPNKIDEMIQFLKERVDDNSTEFSLELICEIILHVNKDTVDESCQSIYETVLGFDQEENEAAYEKNSTIGSSYSSGSYEFKEMLDPHYSKDRVFYSLSLGDKVDRHEAFLTSFNHGGQGSNEDIDGIDIITYSNEKAIELTKKYEMRNPILLSSKDLDSTPIADSREDDSTFNGDTEVRIGTLAQLVQAESNQNRNEARKRLLLLDDADHFIFNNPFVRQTTALTTAGTYSLFPVLQFVLNQVKSELGFVKDNNINFTENETIDYLRSTFYDLKPDLTDIRYRLKCFDNEKVLPKNISYDYAVMNVKDIFDDSKILYSSNVPINETKISLRGTEMPLDTTIIFGKVYSHESEQRSVWLYFKSQRDLQHYKRTSQKGDITWKRLDKNTLEERKVNWAQMKNVSSDTVFSRAKKIMIELDNRRKLINEKDLSSLDEIIFYLRYVHLYCFYSQKQFSDLSDMIENGFYPILRREQGIKQDSNGEELCKCPRDDRYLGGFFTSQDLCPGLMDIIRPLPDVFKVYCVEQLDKWVKTCYCVVKRSDIDSPNLDFKEIKWNEDKLLEALFPFDEEQDNEFKQIFQLHNSLELTPIYFANRYTHIKKIFEGYSKVRCFSDVPLTDNKVEIIKGVYGFDEISSSAQENQVKFCTFASSVIKNQRKWLDAVCKSVVCQVRLQKNVFLFCESEFMVFTQILPKLSKVLQEEQVCIVAKVSDLQEKTLYPRVIIATPSSARSINYSFESPVGVKGNHVCMTFTPTSNIDQEYCLQKRIVGCRIFKNTCQYIVYNETDNSKPDCLHDKDYTEKIKARSRFWDKLTNVVESFNCSMNGENNSIESYKHAIEHQAFAFWMKRTLMNAGITSRGRLTKEFEESTVTLDEDFEAEYGAYIENLDESLVFLGKLLTDLISEQTHKRANIKESEKVNKALSRIFNKYREKLKREGCEHQSIFDALALYYFAVYEIRKLAPSYSHAIKLLDDAEKLLEGHILPVYEKLFQAYSNDEAMKNMIKILKDLSYKIDAAIKAIKQVSTTKKRTYSGVDVVQTDLMQVILSHGPMNKNFVRSHCISIGLFGLCQVSSKRVTPSKQAVNINPDNNDVSDMDTDRPIFKNEKQSRRIKNPFSTGLFGFKGFSGETKFAPFKSFRSGYRKKMLVDYNESSTVKSTKKEGFFPSFPFLVEYENGCNSFDYRVRKLAVLRLSNHDFKFFEQQRTTVSLRNIAEAFQVVIYYSNKFYAPSTGRVRMLVYLESVDNNWRIAGVESLNVYDLFFKLYDCQNIAILKN